MDKAVKIILAILFFLCLTELPYGFYQFVRLAALIGFTILGYRASEKENKTEMIVYIILAILFQPLIKIALGREIWNIVDVILGMGLFISIFTPQKQINEK
jgi:hypothetical protein